MLVLFSFVASFSCTGWTWDYTWYIEQQWWVALVYFSFVMHAWSGRTTCFSWQLVVYACLHLCVIWLCCFNFLWLEFKIRTHPLHDLNFTNKLGLRSPTLLVLFKQLQHSLFYNFSYFRGKVLQYWICMSYIHLQILLLL